MTTRPRPQPRTRIVDVARVAGVSAQTVSNVVNDKPGFSEETRRRVLEAIQETGYRPNRAAQNLRTRRSSQVAFHLSGRQMDVRNPFTLTLLRHLVEEAERRGYRVTVMTDSSPNPDHFRDDVNEQAVDGYLLSDCDLGDPRVAVLTEAGTPFVVMGRTLPGQPQNWVDLDNTSSMRMLVDHVVARGHREIAYVRYPGVGYWEEERMAGVVAGLAAHGLELRPDRLLVSDLEGVRSQLRPLLSAVDRPTAVLASSDSLAVRVVAAAQALGLHPGEDLAVTGFDGCALETVTDPPLTTAQIPVARIASAMLDRLARAIDGAEPEPGLLLSTSLFRGATA